MISPAAGLFFGHIFYSSKAYTAAFSHHMPA